MTHIKYKLIIRQYCNFLAVCSRKDGGVSSSVFFIFFTVYHPNHTRYHTDILSYRTSIIVQSSHTSQLSAIQEPSSRLDKPMVPGPRNPTVAILLARLGVNL